MHGSHRWFKVQFMKKYVLSASLILSSIIFGCSSGSLQTSSSTSLLTVTDPPVSTPETHLDEDGSIAPEDTSLGVSTSTATIDEQGALGTREEPILIGDGHDLGNGWSLVVTKVNFDGAYAVLEANQFNDPPTEGRSFVLVDISLGYNGSSDPSSPAFEVSIDAVGSQNISYSSSECGILPNSIDSMRDLFTGGAISGQVCFDADTSDIQSLTLYASSGFFGGKDSFFSLNQQSLNPTGLNTSIGPVLGASSTQARLNPTPVGTAGSISDNWEFSVKNSMPDGTDLVLSENQFNDLPPIDHTFFLSTVVLTNVGQEKQDSLLGVSIKAVGIGNVEYDSYGCGVIPGELDTWGTQIFPGGSIEGTICFVVPKSEADDGVVLYVNGETFGETPYTFATMP